MRSYSVPEEEIDTAIQQYPRLMQNRTLITPIDSPFDRQAMKRKIIDLSKSKAENIGSSDGNVRKYFKKM